MRETLVIAEKQSRNIKRNKSKQNYRKNHQHGVAAGYNERNIKNLALDKSSNTTCDIGNNADNSRNDYRCNGRSAAEVGVSPFKSRVCMA